MINFSMQNYMYHFVPINDALFNEVGQFGPTGNFWWANRLFPYSTRNADLAVGTTWRHGTITNNGFTALGNYMMSLSKLLTNMLRCWSKTSLLKWTRNAVVNRFLKFTIIHSGLVACNWNQSLEVLEESDVDPNTWTASRIPKHHHSRGNHLNPPVVLDFFGAPRE